MTERPADPASHLYKAIVFGLKSSAMRCGSTSAFRSALAMSNARRSRHHGLLPDRGRMGRQVRSRICPPDPSDVQGALADKWHLDEMVVSIKGRKHWLWRAVDANGHVLDALVQSRRDRKVR